MAGSIVRSTRYRHVYNGASLLENRQRCIFDGDVNLWMHYEVSLIL